MHCVTTQHINTQYMHEHVLVLFLLNDTPAQYRSTMNCGVQHECAPYTINISYKNGKILGP